MAVEAVLAARQPHHFLAVSKDGRAAIASTTGNADGHIVLRGGRTPNYHRAGVAEAATELARAGLREALMIELLYRSGQVAAAAQRAKAFLARFPESPHASQVQQFAAQR